MLRTQKLTRCSHLHGVKWFSLSHSKSCFTWKSDSPQTPT